MWLLQDMHCKSPFPEIKVSAHDENRHNIFNLLMHSLSSHSRHTVGDVEEPQETAKNDPWARAGPSPTLLLVRACACLLWLTTVSDSDKLSCPKILQGRKAWSPVMLDEHFFLDSRQCHFLLCHAHFACSSQAPCILGPKNRWSSEWVPRAGAK